MENLSLTFLTLVQGKSDRQECLSYLQAERISVLWFHKTQRVFVAERDSSRLRASTASGLRG